MRHLILAVAATVALATTAHGQINPATAAGQSAVTTDPAASVSASGVPITPNVTPMAATGKFWDALDPAPRMQVDGSNNVTQWRPSGLGGFMAFGDGGDVRPAGALDYHDGRGLQLLPISGQSPMLVPGVGVSFTGTQGFNQTTTGGTLTGELYAFALNRWAYVAGFWSCPSGTNAQNPIWAENGFGTSATGRTPAFMCNKAANTLEVDFRDSAGSNAVTVDSSPCTATSACFAFYARKAGIPCLTLVSVSGGALVTSAETCRSGTHKASGYLNSAASSPGYNTSTVGGGGQPMTLSAFGTGQDEASDTFRAWMLNWGQRRIALLAGVTPPDALTIPLAQTPLVANQGFLSIAQFSPNCTPAPCGPYGVYGTSGTFNDGVAWARGTTMASLYPGAADGTGGWSTTFDNKFDGGKSATDSVTASLITSDDMTGGPNAVYSTGIPYNGATSNFYDPARCQTGLTDPDGTTYMHGATLYTGPANPVGGSTTNNNPNARTCLVSTVNVAGYGFSQKYGFFQTKFRAQPPSAGNNANGATDRGIGFNFAPLWHYTMSLWFNQAYPYGEYDTSEIYNRDGYTRAGTSGNTNIHTTLWSHRNKQPRISALGYPYDTSGAYDGRTKNDATMFLSPTNAPWPNVTDNIFDGTWHTISLIEDPVRGVMVNFFDGYLVSVTAMPAIFQGQALMMISGTTISFGIVTSATGSVTTGDYSMDVAEMLARQYQPWSTLQ